MPTPDDLARVLLCTTQSRTFIPAWSSERPSPQVALIFHIRINTNDYAGLPMRGEASEKAGHMAVTLQGETGVATT